MAMASSTNAQQQQQWPSSSTTGGSVVNMASYYVPTKLWSNYTSTNYRAWKEQMLCLIQSQGWLGFIDGTTPSPPDENQADGTNGTTSTSAWNQQDYQVWRRADVLLKGWILCSLSDDLVCGVSSLKTSRDVWLELENRFQSLSNPGPPATADGPMVSRTSVEPTPNVETEQNTTITKDWKEYLPLYRAALKGNWEAAKEVFDKDSAAMTAGINYAGSTALHLVAGAGTGKAIQFLEKLVAAMPDESVGLENYSGITALHVAAAVGNIKAADVLVNRMHRLLYIRNKFGDFPIQLAALYAQEDMLKYLISVTKDHFAQNPYDGLAGLRLLIYVTDAEFFDIALGLVHKYPGLARLKLSDNTTALKTITAKKSVLCSDKGFGFWERLISSLLRNSYGIPWKFMEQSGIIKSIKDKSMRKQKALQLVKHLCIGIESLSFMEAQDTYVDAIMVAAELGIHEIVEEIVETFPSAVHGYPGQDIFHVAVENRSEHVFNLIYQMSNNKHLFSNTEDSNGNNLLHSAGKLAPSHKLNEISGAALQMQREIQWYKEVEKIVPPHYRERRNRSGKSPQMVFSEEHKILKEEGERWMKDTANSCTFAAALIATVMFAAAITVPGGNEGSTGFPMFSRDSAFIVFAVSDAVSLFTSVTSLLMFLAILTSRYAEEDFLRVLPKRLIIGLGTLFFSITFMMAAFSATLYLVFGTKHAWILIPVGALACLPITSFVLLQFPLLIDLISSTYGRGIFGKQSNRPFY